MFGRLTVTSGRGLELQNGPLVAFMRLLFLHKTCGFWVVHHSIVRTLIRLFLLVMTFGEASLEVMSIRRSCFVDSFLGNWTKVPTMDPIWTPRYAHSVVAFGPRVWLAGGFGNHGNSNEVKDDLWSSFDMSMFSFIIS
jgi:hypothetical protein